MSSTAALSLQGIVPAHEPPLRQPPLGGLELQQPSVVRIEAATPPDVLGLFDQSTGVELVQSRPALRECLRWCGLGSGGGWLPSLVVCFGSIAISSVAIAIAVSSIAIAISRIRISRL